jgi:hypothetical protein
MHIGGLSGPGAVWVDDDQLGAALLARLGDVVHHVDLGRDRVAAPDDDQIGLRHLAAIDAALGTVPDEPAGIGQRVANRRMLSRIAHRMAQTLQPIALHQAHRAGIVMRPDRLGAVALGGTGQPLSDEIERVVPGDRRERGAPDALVADPAQRHRKAIRMVLPLGIAPDLGADDTVGVALRLGTANATDTRSVDPLDLERAGARAIMRADAEHGIERQKRAPRRVCTHNTSVRRLW